MAKKKKTAVKKKSASGRKGRAAKAVALGAGALALGAGAYYLLGPNGKKHRAGAKRWAAKAEKEIMQVIERSAKKRG